MECAELAKRVKQWIQAPQNTVNAEEIQETREHLDNCPACASKYGALPFLWDRDAGLSPISAEKNDPFFPARTMSLIRKATASPSRWNTARGRFLPLIAAAMAVFLFAAGFMIRGLIAPAAVDTINYRFVLYAPSASSVHLIGSFPSWSQNERRAMERGENGEWSISIDLRKDQVYTYSFLLDGSALVPDPASEEIVDDGFGNIDSLLRI